MPKINTAFEGTKNWDNRDMPEFPDGIKCFVLDGAFHGSVVAFMAEAGFSRAKSIEEADLVVFIGGADISPSLYGQQALKCVWSDKARDDYEQAAYQKCLKLRKPMFGICRGAQILAALNGAELWQDVNNHGGHPHWIIDVEQDVRVLSTSLHHQMVKQHNDMTLIACCENQVATLFFGEKSCVSLSARDGKEHELEIEAGSFDKTGCFFVQGHPEIGTAEYRSWTMHKLHQFMKEWDLNNGPSTVDSTPRLLIEQAVAAGTKKGKK